MPVTRQQFVGSSLATLASIGIIVPARAADQFSWKYGNDLPADHPTNLRSNEAFARIAKRTGGQVQIKGFPVSVLGSDPSMLASLRSGAIEMLALPGAFLNSVVPLASIENLAYAFPNRETVFRAMDGDLGAVIRDAIRAANIVVFDKIWENGFRDITTSSRVVRTAADLQGLKIRVSPGKIRIDTFESLGASPTPIALSELYTSLQTHVVDAQENPLVLIEQQKFYEVQKYVALSEHIWSGYWTLVNQDVWNKMPKNLQDIVQAELATSTIQARADTQKLSETAAANLKAKGMVFNAVDKQSFKAKLSAANYYKRWKAEFGDKAWAALEKYANKLA
ncbi:MAG TPA: TRAP transporter substrate-binding protein [Candidatus Sulfotelmatobacter sp.]|nr:TRAP transporter substrate-binding protein [Candidatus Sulfotelmatobacter sp.]